MKKIIIISMIMVTMLSIGCSDNKEKIENNNESKVIEIIEEENYNTFNSLGSTYGRNEDIRLNDIGEEIFNSLGDTPYDRGKFMEVDYAYDFIQKYLSGDNSIYDYIITIDNDYEIGYVESSNEEKERLGQSLQFLREQMYLSSDEPIYFRLSKVTYEGQVDGIEDSITLNVNGHISADNINFLSLSKFTITIVPNKDKLLVNII